MKSRIVLIAALALGGCATAYQPKGLSGGFSETQLDTNVWSVSFKGNGYTREERASDFTLLRCAEIALDHEYQYFVVVDSESYATTSTYTAPTQSYTTGSATAHSYGNTATAYGSSTTTTHGGQTYHISKPSRSITMIALPERPDSFAYNARMVRDQLMAKYEIGKE